MASIIEIISKSQGPYEWGRRDCLITVEEILFQQHILVNYDGWHEYTEEKAIALARKRYGSMLQAHIKIFTEHGLEVLSPPSDLQIGDILLLDGIIFCSQLGISMDTDKLTMLGFVTENYEVWSWFLAGMYPLSKFHVQRIIRCPQS